MGIVEDLIEMESGLNYIHEPVMAHEILTIFQLRPGMTVVDGTLGMGGHSSLFVERIQPGGELIGLDWDREMLEIAEQRLKGVSGVTVTLFNDDFRNLEFLLSSQGNYADAVLLDLGLNSGQIENPTRGFSFQEDGPLDMRMDRTRGEPAAALLNRLSPFEIETLLFEFGDERWARAIAKAIVERRRTSGMKTTQDLVEAVLSAVPSKARETRIHPATRTFQAIRIAVNGELNGLQEAILTGARVLNDGGTFIVLTYHSGEDRIIKNAFKTLVSEGYADLTPKPIVPTAVEISQNRRSRSAKLRAIRKSLS